MLTDNSQPEYIGSTTLRSCNIWHQTKDGSCAWKNGTSREYFDYNNTTKRKGMSGGDVTTMTIFNFKKGLSRAKIDYWFKHYECWDKNDRPRLQAKCQNIEKCNVCGHSLRYHMHTLYDIKAEKQEIPRKYNQNDLNDEKGLLDAFKGRLNEIIACIGFLIWVVYNCICIVLFPEYLLNRLLD